MNESAEFDPELNSNDWEFLKKEFARNSIFIERLLSHGPHSDLLKARQSNLGRDIVVKVLSIGLLSDDIAYLRFQEESKILGSLTHPNIVQLYGVGRLPDGRSYMIMEYLEGKTLEQIIASGESLDESAIRGYAANLCEALIAAHQHKIIHRDVKPSNVIISDTESGGKIARLIDFGIFKRTDGMGGGMQLTQLGSLPGTPNYMSPEQCSKQEVDERSDIYSLGCLLYELIAGKPPMDAETDLLIMSNHINKKVKNVPAKNLVSDGLKNIVLRCLEKDKALRYSGAAELLEELKCSSNTSKNLSARKLALLIVALTTVAICLFASLYFLSPAKKAEQSNYYGRDYWYVDEELGIHSLGWDNFIEKLNEKTNLSAEARENAICRWKMDHIKRPESSIMELAKSSGLDCVPIRLVKPLLERVNALIDSDSKTMSPAELFWLNNLKFYGALRLKLLKECESAALSFYRNKKLHKYKDEEHFDSYACDLITKFAKEPGFSPELLSRLQESLHNPDKSMKVSLMYADSLGINEQRALILSNYAELMKRTKVSDRYLLSMMLDRLRLQACSFEIGTLIKKYPFLPQDTIDVKLAYFYAMLLNANSIGAAEVLHSMKKGFADSESNSTFLGCELHLASVSGQNEKVIKLSQLILRKFGTKILSIVPLRAALEQAVALNDSVLHLCDLELSSDPQFLAIAHAARGHILRDEGKLRESIRDYESSHRYFELDKRHFSGRVNVYIGEATCYVNLKEFEQAKRLLQEALKYNNNQRNAEGIALESSRGVICRAENKLAEAISIHRELLNSFSNDEKTLYAETYCNIFGELCADYLQQRNRAALAAEIQKMTPYLMRCGAHGERMKSYAEGMLAKLN